MTEQQPRQQADGRRRVSSGSPFEQQASYCRAIRVGDVIHVAGTAAYADGAVVAPHDAVGQTRHILAVIGQALQDLGSSLDDAVRYRVYVTDIALWREVVPELGRAFANARPAGTLLAVAALIDPALVVEIEVDAIASSTVG
jgi:enamine deaminase RidA (YjgF/YER057c/UK114 family)